MMLKKLELHGFKSFAKKTELLFNQPVTAIVGPNGSGKSNIVEAIRFVLGEQSSKSLRSSSGKDLIFAGSQHITKMNRAHVSLTFDNTQRVFTLTNAKNQSVNVDFDEITLSRTVFADGSNTYQINGHDVRMKDIIELIASVNIGSSGHHIISQGEADRLLNASAKERKSMIEDALGLKLYQYRIKETQKKLEKTHAHLHEIESVRREIAPHLKFLERQVAKIEKARQLRIEVAHVYARYLAYEELLLAQEKKQLDEQYAELSDTEKTLIQKVNEHKPSDNNRVYPEEQELQNYEKELADILRQKSEWEHTLGKIEGMIEIAQAPLETPAQKKRIRIYLDDVIVFLEKLNTSLDVPQDTQSIDTLKDSLVRARNEITSFINDHRDADDVADTTVSTEKLEGLQESYKDAQEKRDAFIQKENEIREHIQRLRTRLSELQAQEKDSQQHYFEAQSALQDIQSQLRILAMHRESHEKYTQAFNEELEEGKALIGEDIRAYKEYTVDDDAQYDRASQEQLRKELERMKIKLEEIGGGSGTEVIAEYEETKERDAFLAHEIEDVEQSVTKLEVLMSELQTQLEKEFIQGIQHINDQFAIFFERMFGGGKARLKIVEIPQRKKTEEIDEEDETDMGIEILVNLPRKKITHLEMLSGGERSLTSIALLFALSQVNPPPFLVLDETDAALDEANSRRYGDMIESLSEYSQLMVVTHNRETMSRADALFGVTIGAEECSQLLSVRFEQAQEFAK